MIKLTIAIPTYNRVEKLRALLADIVPQVVSDVELLISDNHSSDGTWDYLKSLPTWVRCLRQERNIGSERNILDCIARSQGKYVWILCDDDKVAPGVVKEVVSAITTFNSPPMIYLRSSGRPPRKTNGAYWVEDTATGFIADISHWITFCSSIVVRRDAIDQEFLRRQIGSFLIPAAMALSAASRHDRIVLSAEQLIFPSVGERGAYDAVGIFGRNLSRLLNEFSRQNLLDASDLKKLYENNLEHVVGSYIQSDWPLRSKSALYLIICSWNCRALYVVIFPKLLKRIVRRAIIRPTINLWLARLSGRSTRADASPHQREPY